MEGDKKKVAVLAALGVCLVAAGAWQLLGPRSEPSTAKPTPGGNERLVAQNEEPPQLMHDDFAYIGAVRRDPFLPAQLSPADPDDPPTSTQPPTPPPAPQPPRQQIRSTITGNGLPPTGPMVITPERFPDEFTHSLVGIVEGPTPVAVFQSEAGMQTMVRVGGHIGPRSRVASIGNGRVTVVHNGKTMTLIVGGNSQ